MVNDERLPDILLDYLRDMLADVSLEYASAPKVLSGGFDTTIYAFELRDAPAGLAGPLILRLFLGQNPWVTFSSENRARFETVVQTTVRGLGYPAPRPVLTCPESEPLGAPFLVMERIPGKIMLDAAFRPSPLILRLPRLLAETQARLHSLDPSSLAGALRSGGMPGSLGSAEWLDLIAEFTRADRLDGLEPGVEWLRGHARSPSRDVICHGDLHPLNVLMERGQVSGVIDWSFVRLADAEYDVGATIAIFRQGPLQMPSLLRGLVDPLRSWFVSRYLAEYQKLRPLDMLLVKYYEAMRCMGFLVEAGQTRQAGREPSEVPSKPTAFGDPVQVLRIATRFRELTGATVTLPD